MDFQQNLGELLGCGGSRFVYLNLADEKTVIKVHRPKVYKKNLRLSNEIEWRIWNQYLGTPYEMLFCPCHAISPDGQYLVQSRAEVLTPGKHLKRSRNQWAQLPDVIKRFPDSKWSKNWGRFEARYVLIDYARHPVSQSGTF